MVNMATHANTKRYDTWLIGIWCLTSHFNRTIAAKFELAAFWCQEPELVAYISETPSRTDNILVSSKVDLLELYSVAGVTTFVPLRLNAILVAELEVVD